MNFSFEKLTFYESRVKIQPEKYLLSYLFIDFQIKVNLTLAKRLFVNKSMNMQDKCNGKSTLDNFICRYPITFMQFNIEENHIVESSMLFLSEA